MNITTYYLEQSPMTNEIAQNFRDENKQPVPGADLRLSLIRDFVCEKALTSLERNARDVPELVIPSNVLCDLLKEAEEIQQKDDAKRKQKKLERVEMERVINEPRRQEAEQRRQAITPKRMVENVVKAISPRKSSRIRNMTTQPSYKV